MAARVVAAQNSRSLPQACQVVTYQQPAIQHLKNLNFLILIVIAVVLVAMKQGVLRSLYLKNVRSPVKPTVTFFSTVTPSPIFSLVIGRPQ